jgi:hypothetical protein
MTVLVLGLDGMDYHRVQNNDYLSEFDVQHLHQDLDGPNALFTKRVWPCIFAGTSGGASDPDEKRAEYQNFSPDSSYIWEQYPSVVALPPIPDSEQHENMEELPHGWMESFSPEKRIEKTLNALEKEIHKACEDPGIRVIIAVTRTPDIVGHHLPEKAKDYHDRVDQWVSGLEFPENYLIVSDHGFDEFGTKGIEGHSEDAIFASNFANYDSMTEFCENWTEDFHEIVREDEMKSLGYI